MTMTSHDDSHDGSIDEYNHVRGGNGNEEGSEQASTHRDEHQDSERGESPQRTDHPSAATHSSASSASQSNSVSPTPESPRLEFGSDNVLGDVLNDPFDSFADPETSPPVATAPRGRSRGPNGKPRTSARSGSSEASSSGSAQFFHDDINTELGSARDGFGTDYDADSLDDSLHDFQNVTTGQASPNSAPGGSDPMVGTAARSRTTGGETLLGGSLLSQVPRYHRMTVDQPQKISDGSSAYVTYLVTSQASPEERPERVRRRFSDFSKLYDYLVAEFPGCAVPPLPDRWRLEYIAGDRFSPEFTNKRAAALERFLFRASQHPSLRQSRSFGQFLSGNASKQALPKVASADSGVSGALDHLSDSLMNAFSKAKYQSKEMTDARERADRYEQNIGTIDKAVLRSAKYQSDLASDFEDLHKQATKLAKLDPANAEEFAALAAAADGLRSETLTLRNGVDSRFAGALRDMSHYVRALKGMLKQREQRQIDYEALVEYLQRSEHELVAAEHGYTAPAFTSSFIRAKVNELRGVDREQTRQARITKLKNRISEFRTESARAKEISDECEDLALREVRIFDQTEAIELQQSLTGLADSYIEFYRGVLRQCNELESSLE